MLQDKINNSVHIGFKQEAQTRFSTASETGSSEQGAPLPGDLYHRVVALPEVIATRRQELCQAEMARNNPDFIGRALMRDEQFFMPWKELVSRADESAVRRALVLDRYFADRRKRGPGAFDGDPLVQSGAKLTVAAFAVPHRRYRDVGSFPGEPTPLLHATAVVQALSRSGLWPGVAVPEHSLAYPPVLRHPEMDRIHDEMRNAHVVAMSVMSESHSFALEIMEHYEDSRYRDGVIVLGGSFHDGTNPVAIARAAKKIGEPLSDEEMKMARKMAFFGEPREQRAGIFVVAGDGAYLYAKLLQIISDNMHLTGREVYQAVEERMNEFSLCPGAGEIFWWNPDRKEVVMAHASGKEIDRNLDPFITRGVNDNRFWIFGNKRVAQVIFNDGCPEACSYCDESLGRKTAYELRKVSGRSARNMLLEVERAIENGVEALFFDDSFFLQKPSHLMELFDGLIAIRAKYPTLEWGCQTTMDSIITLGVLQHNNYPYLQKLKEAGCSYVYTGLEGVNPAESTVSTVTKALKKSRIPGEPDASWRARFTYAADLMLEAGIRLGASLMCGLGEDLASTRELFELIAEYHRKGVIPEQGIALNVTTLYPGTVDMRRKGLTGQMRVDYREELRSPVTGFETLCQFSLADAEYAAAFRDLAYEICGKAIVGFQHGPRLMGLINSWIDGVGEVYVDPVDGTSYPQISYAETRQIIEKAEEDFRRDPQQRSRYLGKFQDPSTAHWMYGYQHHPAPS